MCTRTFPQHSARFRLGAVTRKMLVGAAVTLAAACNDDSVLTDPQQEGTAIPEAAADTGMTTTAVAAAMTPAGGDVICFPVFDSNGNIIDWICHPLPVRVDPCPFCPLAISFDHLIDPSPDPWYVEDVAAGLGLLGQAAVNPEEAQRLQMQAGAAFLSAARRLGDGQIRPGEVGIADPRRNVIDPEPDPWLVAAGGDLVDGLTLMQQALVRPTADRLRQEAMAEFEQAYQEISQQRPLGG